jgi:predicted CopG family antitoxin
MWNGSLLTSSLEKKQRERTIMVDNKRWELIIKSKGEKSISEFIREILDSYLEDETA